jgi:hypothetical protein
MSLNRLDADFQPLTNLFVFETGPNQLENFLFPRRQ